ncbi:MAG: NADH-quinone oxidoreductase subunit C [Actinomycetia bacterium]|nr:NADH-quinone oxidoreductase subunit C [Actinomycetes bacterium]
MGDTEGAEELAVDEARGALLEALELDLGDAIVGTHLEPGRDLWIRVNHEVWASTADYLRNRQRFRFFDWLSVVDWLPSPYGRSLEAEVDGNPSDPPGAGDAGSEEDNTLNSGVTGGSSRFQMMARVHNLTASLGLTIKADLGPDLAIATWTEQYPGADWHEREAWEMFGVTFLGHPGLRHLYLPSGFEGHPMRKDYPLLARLVKPWPGIVDVEPMPPLPSAANGAPEGGGS